MRTHIAIFERKETPAGSIVSDLFTFAMLTLCIWFSWHMGGGIWTFVCLCLFLLSLSAKWQLGPGHKQSGWVKLRNKQEAIEWANSLPEDESCEGVRHATTAG